jgi:hypothetical protein
LAVSFDEVDIIQVFDIDQTSGDLTPHVYTGVTAGYNCAVQGHESTGFLYSLGHAGFTRTETETDDILVGENKCSKTGEYHEGVIRSVVMGLDLDTGEIQSWLDGRCARSTPQVQPLCSLPTECSGCDGQTAYANFVAGAMWGQPGWVAVTFTDERPGRVYDDEIVLVGPGATAGDRPNYRWGRTHTGDTNYRGEAHAVASPDGTMVAFASTWTAHCTTGCGTSTVYKDYIFQMVTPTPPPSVEPRRRIVPIKRGLPSNPAI